MATNNHSPNEAGTPDHLRELFQTDQILWFNDGRWGLAGYALPNCQGKTWTNNVNIYHLVDRIGRALFHMSHQKAVQFEEPPHKDFWWQWQMALVSARSNLLANRLDEGTSRNLPENHVSAAPKTFLVYPVPFFGNRIRQEDLRLLIELTLQLLGHIMQHSSNEKGYYIPGDLVDDCVGFINEMLRLVAVKYFNYTIAEVTAEEPEFRIADERFTAENYRPRDIIPSTEISVERPTRLWWPTENDLSAIRGIQITTATQFAARWPVDYLTGEGDWESTLPGIVDRVSEGDLVKPVAQNDNRPTGSTAP